MNYAEIANAVNIAFGYTENRLLSEVLAEDIEDYIEKGSRFYLTDKVCLFIDELLEKYL